MLILLLNKGQSRCGAPLRGIMTSVTWGVHLCCSALILWYTLQRVRAAMQRPAHPTPLISFKYSCSPISQVSRNSDFHLFCLFTVLCHAASNASQAKQLSPQWCCHCGQPPSGGSSEAQPAAREQARSPRHVPTQLALELQTGSFLIRPWVL